MRADSAIVFTMILLWTAKCNGRRAQMLFENDDPDDCPRQRMAWDFCSKQIMEKKGSCEDGHGNLKTTTLLWRNKHKAISVLSPELKNQILNCLRKKHPLSEEVLCKWLSSAHKFIECFHSVHSLLNALIASSPPGVQERVLFQRVVQHKGDSSDGTPNSKTSKRSAEKEDDTLKQILVAIVATAATTFSLVSLLFCCCCRSEFESDSSQRDDGPLFSIDFLRSSDFHDSSSQDSISFGNYANKFNSFHSKTSDSFKSIQSKKFDNHDSSVKKPAIITSSGEVIPPLKPPPGRVIPPPRQQPEPPSNSMVPSPPTLPKTAATPPVPPPAPKAPPPMPPRIGRAPAPPPRGNLKPSIFGSHLRDGDAGNGASNSEGGSQKAKLKPFFWDKVSTNPDQSMVWHHIVGGSFQFNEEMMESLFGYSADGNNKRQGKRDSSTPSVQFIQIIDTRKAQNLSILLKAQNVTTEEVINAIREGNELPVELLQTILKMTLTAEEELKLRLFNGDFSLLGPAEKFLKVLVETPFASKRIESLLFMITFQEDFTTLKESFATLEVACNKLRSSRLFLKLLEAVLKTGNRMNVGTYRGGAHAFKLDTLLKLSDVKGTDGNTTLLHFVVQEIIRSEGVRAVRTRTRSNVSSVRSEDLVEDSTQISAEQYRSLGLQVVSGLSKELEVVKKAAFIDANALTSTHSKLRQSLIKAKAFLENDMTNLGEESEFTNTLASFVNPVHSDMSWLLEEEKRIMALVKSTADYFHGKAGMDEGLRLFSIVSSFLVMLDKVCKEIGANRAVQPMKPSKSEAKTIPGSDDQRKSDLQHRQLFPAIKERRMDSSSSDDD